MLSRERRRMDIGKIEQSWGPPCFEMQSVDVRRARLWIIQDYMLLSIQFARKWRDVITLMLGWRSLSMGALSIFTCPWVEAVKVYSFLRKVTNVLKANRIYWNFWFSSQALTHVRGLSEWFAVSHSPIQRVVSRPKTHGWQFQDNWRGKETCPWFFQGFSTASQHQEVPPDWSHR